MIKHIDISKKDFIYQRGAGAFGRKEEFNLTLCTKHTIPSSALEIQWVSPSGNHSLWLAGDGGEVPRAVLEYLLRTPLEGIPPLRSATRRGRQNPTVGRDSV